MRESILERVQDRKLLPGDRVDERELRERLSLSATPVREALISLVVTGVFERRPGDGARITSLSLEGLMKMNDHVTFGHAMALDGINMARRG